MKQCSKCHIVKPLSEFTKQAKNKDGLKNHCKDCHKQIMREWHEENPSDSLLRNYGITIEEKQQMIADQNNCCAICKNPFTDTKNTHVDHCHATSVIRGILCNNCNHGLGKFKDSTKILEQAKQYLGQNAQAQPITPVPAADNPKSQDNPEHGALPPAGFRENDYHLDHRRRTISRENADHCTETRGRDSLGHRSTEMGTPKAPARLKDNGNSQLSFSWIED